jgi:hypothetical protein
MFKALNMVLAVVLCALLVMAFWPALTHHHLNGQPCGHPPPGSHGGQGDERDCHMPWVHPEDDRPEWCC